MYVKENSEYFNNLFENLQEVQKKIVLFAYILTTTILKLRL